MIDQDVSLCELPLMTDTGSFIFNGAERIVVSQLHRSPGIIFEDDDEAEAIWRDEVGVPADRIGRRGGLALVFGLQAVLAWLDVRT